MIEGPGGGTDGPTGVLGDEHLAEELCGLRFRISHDAFLQTNTEMAERLYAIAARVRRPRPAPSASSTCSAGSARSASRWRAEAGEVWGIEGVARRDRRRRASTPSRTGSRTPTSSRRDARLGIRPLIEEAGKPDVVVIDPPRAGLSAKIVRRVIECEAKRIVYVSCNPTTLAPNAAQMVEAGYTLRRVKPVDMFPQTPHIECVALLERPSGGAPTDHSEDG